MGRTTFDFTGALALVTGGTSGIGNATATALRDAGASVTITGTRGAATEYDTDLDGMEYVQLQVTDNAAVEQFAASIPAVDIVINNAGANFPGGLDETTPDGFEASVAVNLTAPYRLTAGLHDALTKSTMAGGASVVNLTSMSAIRAVPIVPGYGSAKAGITAMTRNLAMQWASDGIRVNAIAPGLVDTPMTAPMKHMPGAMDHQLAHIPLGRFAQPGEIAATIMFLCTENSAYTTGSVFVVDGGYTAV